MSYASLESAIRRVVVEKSDDYEGEMARAQLKSIADKASKLADAMKDDAELEAWIQSKITTAEDYISTVHDYMTYKDKK